MRRFVLLAAVPLAFLGGFIAARSSGPARAADAMLTPEIIDLGAMTDDQIGPANAAGLRARGLVATLQGTVGVQSGNVVKHIHTNSDEIQYILSGSGSFWLGDRQRQIHPGDLIIIPKGTPHSGSVATSGPIRAIAIKLPPQAADDFHPVK